MKRFIIEREIPGASELTEEQLAEISKTSNAAVASLGVPYTWVTSYVAGDKVYCVHEADDEETIREHARRGGFPADVVSVVANEFGPQTADARRLTAERRTRPADTHRRHQPQRDRRPGRGPVVDPRAGRQEGEIRGARASRLPMLPPGPCVSSHGQGVSDGVTVPDELAGRSTARC